MKNIKSFFPVFRMTMFTLSSVSIVTYFSFIPSDNADMLKSFFEFLKMQNCNITFLHKDCQHSSKLIYKILGKCT
jgi:hypothetical protein